MLGQRSEARRALRRKFLFSGVAAAVAASALVVSVATPSDAANTTFGFANSVGGSTSIAETVSGEELTVTASGGSFDQIYVTTPANAGYSPITGVTGNALFSDTGDATTLTLSLGSGQFDLKGLSILDVSGASNTLIAVSNKGTANLGTINTSPSSNATTLTTSDPILTGVTQVALSWQSGSPISVAIDDIVIGVTPPATVPDPPTIGTATAGNTNASVAFTAPANDGGAAITTYTVTASPGGATGTGSSSPITVIGLTNGTAYTFSVTATNSVGQSNASSGSNAVTPKASQAITFNNPGTQNFGTSPTLSATADSGLTPTFTSSTTGVCTITSGGTLTFVTAGSCTINADQTGDGSFLPAPQVSRTFTVAAVVPGAPTIGTATAGDTQASVTFSAPSNTGGSAITGYTVTASPGGFTGTGASSPITVTGLTNGTAYTFTVTATNTAGTGPASNASNSATPAAAQTITFNNPGTQNFGTTPTLSASSDSGLTPTFTSSTTGVCTVTSGGQLTFVTAGTCTINADQSGDGSYSPAPQVSQSFTVDAISPGAPTSVSAVAGSASASVSFTAPASNGGSAITSYTVTASPGGLTGSGASSPITVSGLTNGTAYSFTVTATNSNGTGVASSSSLSVVPKGTQTISFNNPGAQNFGTTPTLTATATSGLTPAFTSTTTGVCTITSGGLLSFVSTGTCTIDVDQAGNAAFLAAPTVSGSFAVNAVVPGVPTAVSATAGNASASVAFTPPSSDGGSAITGYTVSASPSGLTGTGTSSPITVSGLTNGMTYTFTVVATNGVGSSSGSSASSGVTPTAPTTTTTTTTTTTVAPTTTTTTTTSTTSTVAPTTTTAAPTTNTSAAPTTTIASGSNTTTTLDPIFGNPLPIVGGSSSNPTTTTSPASTTTTSTAPAATASTPTTTTNPSAAAGGQATTTTAAPSTGSIVVTINGWLIRVRGRRFLPNWTYRGFLFSDPILLGEFTTDANGEFDFSAEVPAGLTGNHTVKIEDATKPGIEVGGLVVAQQPIVIGPQADSPRVLAFTGSSPLALVTAALILIGAGAMLVRRRKRPAA